MAKIPADADILEPSDDHIFKTLLTPLEMWSVFFKFAPDPKHRDFVNKIIEIKSEVGMASALLMEISKDEHERARLRSRRMYETDRYSDLATAEARGEARGMAKGEAMGMARGEAMGMARGIEEVFTLLEKGISLADAKKMLGR